MCSDDSGKLLPIKVLRPGCDEPDCHHIFFDDNIERDRPHIVDVRNIRTGAPVALADSINRCVASLSSAVLDVIGVLTRCVHSLGLVRRYIVKAEPIEAVLDREYYVKALNLAEDDLWLHWRYELLL